MVYMYLIDNYNKKRKVIKKLIWHTILHIICLPESFPLRVKVFVSSMILNDGLWLSLFNGYTLLRTFIGLSIYLSENIFIVFSLFSLILFVMCEFYPHFNIKKSFSIRTFSYVIVFLIFCEINLH